MASGNKLRQSTIAQALQIVLLLILPHYIQIEISFKAIALKKKFNFEMSQELKA